MNKLITYAHDFTAVFNRLAEAGVASVAAEFDGYGDQGMIESITFFNNQNSAMQFNSQDALALELTDLCCALLNEIHAGWQDSDGSFGTLRLSIEKRQVHLCFNVRFTDHTTTEQCWEV